MKAIQYSQLGGPEVLQYIDVKNPVPKNGEILMRVKAAALNHVDIHYRKGMPGKKTNLPHIPGSDGAGVVEKISAGVMQLKIGQRILMNPGISCGKCEQCQQGEKSLCYKYEIMGHENQGTYAELISIPAENAIPLPDHIDFETAAASPLAYLTAWSMVVTKAQVKKNDMVLVMGAGSGVSMAAIQVCKMLGATVFTTASTQEKMNLAKEKLGVDEVLNYTKTPIDQEIRKLTNKKGCDVVIDHVGGEQWVPILRATRNGGTIVTCGATAGHDPQEDLRHIFFRQLRIFGSTMGNDEELKKVMNYIFEGKLKPIIDKVYPLKDASEAHHRMENRKSFGKIILKP